MYSTAADESKLKPLVAPTSGRAKDNELLPVKQSNIQVFTKSFSDPSLISSKSNMKPFFDKSEQVLLEPSKMDNMVNDILLADQPLKNESTQENLQAQQTLTEKCVDPNEQSMYTKELIGSAPNEFSFEELRAERYFKSRHQDIIEKNNNLSKLREELRCQIKEKEELLMLRKSKLLQPQVDQDLAAEDEESRMSTAPFKIFSEAQPSSTLVSSSHNPYEDEKQSLSPIQETSMDVLYSTMSGLCPPSAVGAQSTAVSHLEDQSIEPGRMDQSSPSTQASSEDPCCLDVRRKLLEEMDWSANPNVNIVAAPLPPVEEDMLCLGDESFLMHKVLDCEEYSIYQGFGLEEVSIKVDHCTVLWDFYISLQFAERQSKLVQALKPLTNVPTCCYLFLDGCITVYKVPVQDTLNTGIELCPLQKVAGLVELVRSLHSCHLLLGVVNPETLFVSQNVFVDGNQAAAVVPVDFSSFVDLELQTGVTTAEQLSTAHTFISQGLLDPTADPYRVDLMHFAETVHKLLTKKNMHLVKVDLEWVPEEYSKADTSFWLEAFWNKFFRILLNAGDKTSVSVLNQLLQEIDCI